MHLYLKTLERGLGLLSAYSTRPRPLVAVAAVQYPRSVYRCRASPGQSTVTAVHYYRDNGTVQDNRTAVTVDWSGEV